MSKSRIAIFASGSGTNAEEFFKKFKDHHLIEVALLLSNKSSAFVLERAKTHNIPTKVFTREQLNDGSVTKILEEEYIDFIVLAGFMWLIPTDLVAAFPNQIVNIHPALLPKYGGKGMYGMNVHRSVIANRENSSGITIHMVNEKYDDGNIIFQASVQIEANESPESLAEKIHSLEYRYYPQVVEQLLLASATTN